MSVWSEVVTTLTITDVSFLDYNTTAKITATATGGDSIAGIEVNGEYLEGNPVVYKVSKGTELLNIQARNTAGDRSPMLNKPVPKDVSKGTLKLSIDNPGWTNGERAKVKITARDQSRIAEILARTAEDDDWSDITDERYIYITSDTTVYASVQNEKGDMREVEETITCFDRVAPKVTATQDGNVVNIRATDDKSGVASILVNNKEYKGDSVFDGKLAYTIPSGTTDITIYAEDMAGNLSRAVELPLTTTQSVMPVIVSPEPAPPEPPEEPELKATANGVAVLNFTVATDRPYKGEDGERKADFLNCTAWRQQAEFVCKYFHKGDPIGIEGSIQTRSYEDKDGNKRTAVEIQTDNVFFVGSGRKSEPPAEELGEE